MLRRSLIVCGVLSSIVYVGADVAASIVFPAYHSFTSQAISELSAIGSPSRGFVVPLFTGHSILALLFGAGVWTASRGSRRLRVTAALLIAIGTIDLVGPLTPMHLRGAETSLTDRLHIAVTFVTVVLIVTAMAYSMAAGLGARYRRFTLLLLAVMVVTGAVAGMDGADVPAGRPTPWLGLFERACIGAYLAWQAMLSIVLLARTPSARREKFLVTRPAPERNTPISLSIFPF